MATREQKLAAVYSEGKSLHVYDTASTSWKELPGFMDWTPSGGERDTRSTGTDSTRPHGVVSNMKAPSLECTFKYVRGAVWDVIDSALINKTVLSFRMDTDNEIVLDGLTAGTDQVAITTAGVCTFTGRKPTIDEFPIGSDIKVGNTPYGISGVSVTGSAVSVTVDAPSSAVSASDYTVETPGERVSFRAKVSIAPTRQFTLAQQSEREGSLTLQCLSILPEPVRIA